MELKLLCSIWIERLRDLQMKRPQWCIRDLKVALLLRHVYVTSLLRDLFYFVFEEKKTI